MAEVVLQHVILPKQNICEESELYYRKTGFPVSRDVFGVKLKRDVRVSFDTYINSLSAEKWAEYTNADTSYSLRLDFCGKFKIELVAVYTKNLVRQDGIVKTEKKKNKKKKREIVCRTLSSHVIESTGRTKVSLPYVTDTVTGLLAFKIKCLEDGGIIYSADYTGEVEEEPKAVKIGIGICTFRREAYVKNNIDNLKKYIFENDGSELCGKVEVFISDNAQTLAESDFSGKGIHLFKNKNTGGSGGFTRCMLAVNNANESGAGFTHILMMDDDIIFDPESVYRTYKLLTLVKDKYADAFVGGAMFRTDKQYIQHANGEYWHGDRPRDFVETHNKNRDMRDLTEVVENELKTKTNYQAWWFCAMPMSICRKDNLPMPFFIKSDDIEYSIRNIKSLILLNGINVWHESFESKYSAPNEYYTIRNYLITACTRNAEIDTGDIVDLLDSYVRYYICNYKYTETKFVCDAIKDFLKGVDYFKSIDLTAFHKSIMGKNYKMVDVKDLPVKVTDGMFYRDTSYKKKRCYLKRVFDKYTINGLLLPAKGYAVLGMWGGSFEQTYRKKFLVRYEPETKKGFILKRSFCKAIKSYLLYVRTRKKLIKKFDRARKEFYDRQGELYSLDNWTTQLGLDKGKY